MAQNLEDATKFLDRFADSWGTNDGMALGEHFTADGTLINPFGERADGREAVAAMYAEYFTGMLMGTSTTLEVESIHSVGEDAAFVDAEQAISAPDGSVLLTVHLVALLANDGDDWRFADARPYAYAEAPA